MGRGRDVGEDEPQRILRDGEGDERDLKRGCKSRDAAEGTSYATFSSVLLYVLFVLSRGLLHLPSPPPPHSRQSPAWYLDVSFLDDDNFLSAARLTYFLPDNGKFHAIVVTIRNKKLIELGGKEPPSHTESPAGEDSLHRVPTRRSSLSRGCSCADEKHAVPEHFFAQLNEAKEGPACPAIRRFNLQHMGFYSFFFLLKHLLEHVVFETFTVIEK